MLFALSSTQTSRKYNCGFQQDWIQEELTKIPHDLTSTLFCVHTEPARHTLRSSCKNLVLTASTRVSCSATSDGANEVMSKSSKAEVVSDFKVGLVLTSQLHPMGVSQLQNLNINGSGRNIGTTSIAVWSSYDKTTTIQGQHLTLRQDYDKTASSLSQRK